MSKVVITDNKLPKIYERPMLEEYYHFFKKLGWGSRSLFPRVIRFTTATDRLTRSDLMDECLIASIEAYKSIENTDIKFVAWMEDDEKESISAVARVKEKEDDIHVAEVLFLDYPTDEQKEKRISQILAFIEEYAKYYGIPTITCEIPKYDDLYLKIARDRDFMCVKENERVKELSQTFLLEKNMLLKRKNNEWTRSRQQGTISHK